MFSSLFKFWRRIPYWTRWWLKFGMVLVVAWVSYDIYGRVRWANFLETYAGSFAGANLDFEEARSERERQAWEPGPRKKTFLQTTSMQKWAHSGNHDAAFTRQLTEFPPGILEHVTTTGTITGWKEGKLIPVWDYMEKPLGSADDSVAKIQGDLSNADSAFAELSRDTKIAGDLWLYNIPRIPKINTFTRLLSLRIRVAIQLGEGERALDDVLCGLRFSDRMREGGSLVGLLVQLAVLGLLEDPIWDGIQSGVWDESQLVRLSEQLKELTIAAEFSRVALYELSLVNRDIDSTERSPGWRRFHAGELWDEIRKLQILNLAATDWDAVGTNFGEIVLPGGHRMNGLRNYGDFWEWYGLRPPDENGQFPVFHVDDLPTPGTKPPWELPLSGMAHARPRLGKIGQAVLERQQFADLAQVACEVERYSQREGHYPQKLEDLAPEFRIPRDRFQPDLSIRYERSSDRLWYCLIASGENRTDDYGDHKKDMVFSSEPKPKSKSEKAPH